MLKFTNPLKDLRNSSEPSEREKFYVTYIDYILSDNKPLVRIAGRNTEGERTIKYLLDTEPYFYVSKALSIPNHPSITRIEHHDKPGVRPSPEGAIFEPVIKIYAKRPNDIAGRKETVQYLRDLFPYTYEADIPYADRIRIDFELNGIIETPKKAYITPDEITHPETEEKILPRLFTLDIENMDDIDIEESKKGKAAITMIVIHDSLTNTYHVFSPYALPDEYKRKVQLILAEWWMKVPKYTYMKDSKIEYHVSDGEKAFLEDTFNFFVQNRPDMTTSWNGEEYDWNVIVERAREIGLNPAIISDFNENYATTNKNKEKMQVFRGLINLDLMHNYQKIKGGTLRFNKLEYVAQEELGVGKLPRTSIKDMVAHDVPRLVAYNIIDVQLTHLIDEKDHISDFYTELAFLTHTSIGTDSQDGLLDKLFLHYTKERFVSPTKPDFDTSKGKKKPKGGLVQDAIKGLHKNVIVVDYKGMYTTIMRSLNVSVETKSSKGEIVASNGVRFRKDIVGVIPEILNMLADKRTFCKHKMSTALTQSEKEEWNIKQLVFKLLGNAFYGMMLYVRFRFADKDVGEAITYTGQFLSTETKNFIQEILHYQTIYGDTDSLFIELDQNREYTYKELRSIGDTVCNQINEHLSFIAEKYFHTDTHVFEIEFDGAYKALFQVPKKSGDGEGAKKRYAGLKYDDDGNLSFKAKGFELVKASTATITKDAQIHVLTQILNGESDKQIRLYLDDLKNQLESDTIPSTHLGQRYNFKFHLKDAPESRGKKGVIAAQDSLYRKYNKGDVLLYYRIGKTPVTVKNVEHLCLEYDEDLPDGFFVDHASTWEDLIVKPLEMILEANDSPWSYINTGKKKVSLKDSIANYKKSPESQTGRHTTEIIQQPTPQKPEKKTLMSFFGK